MKLGFVERFLAWKPYYKIYRLLIDTGLVQVTLTPFGLSNGLSILHLLVISIIRMGLEDYSLFVFLFRRRTIVRAVARL